MAQGDTKHLHTKHIEIQARPTRGNFGLEQKLIEVLDSYLDSRAVRFPRWHETPPYYQRVRRLGGYRSPVRG